jgi:hypothetical protein
MEKHRTVVSANDRLNSRGGEEKKYHQKLMLQSSPQTTPKVNSLRRMIEQY